MRKTIFLTLALLLGLTICASGAWAYDFPNGTLVESYSGASPSGAGWLDVVGDAAVYEVFGGNLTNQADGYHLTIFTNWHPKFNGDSLLNVQTADLFLDTNLDGHWDAAVVLDSARSDFGRVYYDPTITTSFDLYSGNSTSYGGKYDINDPKFVPVLGTSGTFTDTDVLWTLGIPNTVDILLTGITGFDPLSFQFLMSSATCANDTAQGVVPLPPSLLLLGSGFLGMAGLGWRKARKEG